MKDVYKIYEQWYDKHNRHGYFEDEFMAFAQHLLDTLLAEAEFVYSNTVTDDTDFVDYLRAILEI